MIAGYCFSSQGGVESFLDKNGVFTYFALPTILDTYTEGVNDKDLSVGWFFTNANTVESFYAIHGKPAKVFAAPGSPATAAYGINNSSVVVGNGIPGSGGLQQGFVLKSGAYTFTSYPGAYETFFSGVNDSLQVAGDEINAFIDPAQRLRPVGVVVPLCPAARSFSIGIENRSEV